MWLKKNIKTFSIILLSNELKTPKYESAGFVIVRKYLHISLQVYYLKKSFDNEATLIVFMLKWKDKQRILFIHSCNKSKKILSPVVLVIFYFLPSTVNYTYILEDIKPVLVFVALILNMMTCYPHFLLFLLFYESTF